MMAAIERVGYLGFGEMAMPLFFYDILSIR